MMHENRSMRDGYIMRRTAIDHNIPLINNLKIAVLFVNSVHTYIYRNSLKRRVWKSIDRSFIRSH